MALLKKILWPEQKYSYLLARKRHENSGWRLGLEKKSCSAASHQSPPPTRTELRGFLFCPDGPRPKAGGVLEQFAGRTCKCGGTHGNSGRWSIWCRAFVGPGNSFLKRTAGQCPAIQRSSRNRPVFPGHVTMYLFHEKLVPTETPATGSTCALRF